MCNFKYKNSNCFEERKKFGANQNIFILVPKLSQSTDGFCYWKQINILPGFF